MGSPRYMAPEQWTNASTVDARADIYAAGAVFYELLTGQYPLAGLQLAEVIKRIRAGAVPSPKEIRPDLPDGICRVVMRALRPRPEERYPTALHFSEAIKDAQPEAMEATSEADDGDDGADGRDEPRGAPRSRARSTSTSRGARCRCRTRRRRRSARCRCRRRIPNRRSRRRWTKAGPRRDLHADRTSSPTTSRRSSRRARSKKSATRTASRRTTPRSRSRKCRPRSKRCATRCTRNPRPHRRRRRRSSIFRTEICNPSSRSPHRRRRRRLHR